MLYRKKEPNKNLWNGIGGKIEPNETPEQSIRREITEETGIDIHYAYTFFFAGIITWKFPYEEKTKGMYAYIADLPSDYVFPMKKETTEGILAWKKFDWVCDKNNKEVVENLPFFLPKLYEFTVPLQYHLEYAGNHVRELRVSSLPKQL